MHFYRSILLYFPWQAGQPQPDAEVAAAIGQDTLNKVEGMMYSANAQVQIITYQSLSAK